MAIVTNTLTRYDGYRAVREDLANVIYNISPVDVPFMSNIGRENVKNTYFECQTDNLAAASASNSSGPISFCPPSPRVAVTSVVRKPFACP